MPTGTIMKRSVDALKPGARDTFLWDGELRGFGVRVTPAGAKSYVYQYRMGGREARTRRFNIGRHGSPWTPDMARARAKELARDVDQGIDPIDAERERRRQAVDLAFSSYLDLFVISYLKPNWVRWSMVEGILKREALPVLARKPLPNITRSDINAVLDRLADRPAVRRLAYATLRKMFRWALGRGDVEKNPLEGMEAPPAVPSRERVLSDGELVLIWNAAGKLGYPFQGFYRLLMLTGQRREEVAALDWCELDRGEMIWTLPGGRAKNGKTHIVPLSEMARDVLDQIAAADTWPRKGLVFSTTGKSSISGFSKAKRQLDRNVLELAKVEAARQGDHDVEIEHWRVHDLRRTLASGCQRLGVRLEVVEAILNHVSGSKAGIVGVYQRYDYQDEKRSALEAWSIHVANLIRSAATENVVALPVGMAA